MTNTLRPPRLIAAWAAAILIALLWAGFANAAALTFPPLTGRVVDNANVLSPQTEADLTQKLEGLEQTSGHQLVVVTLPSLQGHEIEDYGYQLGRAWGIGQKGKNDGALFIVAPTEHKVRVEVGYGLEGVLTDALSSVILQERVLPRFRTGDIEGGVVSGTQGLIDQLALPEGEARQRVAQASAQPRPQRHGFNIASIIPLIIIFLVISSIFRRRRGGSSAWWLAPLIFSGRGGGGWGGGGWGGGGGGGGFSGGGGSFGGGGSSGSW